MLEGLFGRVKNNPSVQQAQENYNQAVNNLAGMWGNGTIQRGTRSLVYKGACVGGGVAVASAIFTAGGLLLAGATVGISALTHAVIEKYPEMSHKNTMVHETLVMSIITATCENNNVKFHELPLHEQRALAEQAVITVAELKRKGMYKDPVDAQQPVTQEVAEAK
jgi:hypothetical protein